MKMKENAMSSGSSIGAALAWPFLLPGNIACDVLGLPRSEYSDLNRMLVNTLVWTVLGVIVVALVV
jgi:hypothetical protein